MRREAESRRAAHLACFAAPQRAFIGSSLGAWLEHVAQAGVAAVPATQIAALPHAMVVRVDRPLAEDAAAWHAFEAALGAVPDGHMVRFDCCAGIALKEAMAQGREPGAAMRELSANDPRAFDLLCDYPADTVPVWSRPWMAAHEHAGWPVEFRVFVRDDRAVAASSYYPQRSLPRTEAMLGWAQRALDLAQKIADTLATHGRYPWLDTYPRAGCAPWRINASIDFLVAASGEVLFLEAGPPLGAGAHPCCFLDCEEVRGVALAAPSALG